MPMERDPEDKGMALGPEGDALMDRLTQIVAEKFTAQGEDFKMAVFVATGSKSAFAGGNAYCACRDCAMRLAETARALLMDMRQEWASRAEADAAAATAPGKVH